MTMGERKMAAQLSFRVERSGIAESMPSQLVDLTKVQTPSQPPPWQGEEK